jgi:hypothetical protein
MEDGMSKDSTAPQRAEFLTFADILAARRTITVALPHEMGQTQVAYNPNKYTEDVNNRIFVTNEMKNRELLTLLEVRIGGNGGVPFDDSVADQLDATLVGAIASAIIADYFPTKGEGDTKEPTGE